MKLTAIIVAVSITGCSGLITGDDGTGGGGGSGTLEEQIALQKWTNDAYPVFSSACFSCHGGANAQAPWFLKATTPTVMRTLLVGWTTPTVINVATPEMSRVLLKGAHEGAQALDPTQVLAVSGWISAERDAANAGSTSTELTTAKVDVLTCTGGVPGDTTCPINTITLDDDHLVGASISFVAQAYGNDLYLSDIFLKAATDGVYLDHPLFVSWPTGGNEIVDNLDRFSATKLNLVATTTPPICPGPSCDHIGAGAAIFVGFAANNKLSITFKVLEPAHATSTPPPPVGCRTNGFQSFLTTMKPVLTGLCAGCHGGGNAAAKGAMDLSGLASTTDNNACLQVRLHIDTTTPANSTVLRPPNGLDTAHPAQGRLTTATNPTLANFTSAVTTWATAEAANN